MKREWIIGVIALMFILTICHFTSAETIILKSGQEIEGEITEQTNEYIKVNIGGVSVPYFLEDIKRIEGEDKILPQSTVPAQAHNYEKNVEQIIKQAERAVVLIEIAFGGDKKISRGTGFIISSGGLILTSCHGLSIAENIAIELIDGRSFSVNPLMSFDVSKDLCILKIDAPDLPFIKLADSNKVTVGDKVLAIGNPPGQGNVFLECKITSVQERSFGKVLRIVPNLIGGYSGGPVMNMQGEAVGVSIKESEALVINEAKDIISSGLKVGWDEFFQNKQIQSSAYTLLAETDMVAGNSAEAIKKFKMALELNSKNTSASCHLGNIYSDMSEYDQAIEYYEDAIRIEPSAVYAYHGLSVVHFNNGNYDQALKYLEVSLRAEPDNPTVLYDLGILSIATGDLQKSQDCVNKLYSLEEYDTAEDLEQKM